MARKPAVSGPFRWRAKSSIYRDVYRRDQEQAADLRICRGRAGRCLPAVLDQFGESGGCCGAHAGEEVLVGVHREAWMSVAESFGDNLDRDTGRDEQRGVGVAQIVEPNPR